MVHIWMPFDLHNIPSLFCEIYWWPPHTCPIYYFEVHSTYTTTYYCCSWCALEELPRDETQTPIIENATVGCFEIN